MCRSGVQASLLNAPKGREYTCWNELDSDGDPPIMDAIRWRHDEVIKILVDCPRVNLNLKGSNGNTPLFLALKERRASIATRLINSPRIDLGIKDRRGASLQRIARENSMPEICDLIDQAKDATELLARSLGEYTRHTRPC